MSTWLADLLAEGNTIDSNSIAIGIMLVVMFKTVWELRWPCLSEETSKGSWTWRKKRERKLGVSDSWGCWCCSQCDSLVKGGCIISFCLVGKIWWSGDDMTLDATDTVELPSHYQWYQSPNLRNNASFNILFRPYATLNTGVEVGTVPPFNRGMARFRVRKVLTPENHRQKWNLAWPID